MVSCNIKGLLWFLRGKYFTYLDRTQQQFEINVGVASQEKEVGLGRIIDILQQRSQCTTTSIINLIICFLSIQDKVPLKVVLLKCFTS